MIGMRCIIGIMEMLEGGFSIPGKLVKDQKNQVSSLLFWEANK